MSGYEILYMLVPGVKEKVALYSIANMYSVLTTL